MGVSNKQKEYIKNTLTKDFLESEYVDSKKSITVIAEETNIGKTTILRHLKKFNIPIRSKKENAFIALENAKKTNLEKYGTEYYVQSEDFNKKKLETNLEKFGVVNPFQSEDIKEKIKETCQYRYGVDYANQSKIVKDRIKQTCLEKYGTNTAFEAEEVKEKIKQSNLERYGAATPFGSPIVREKVQATHLEKYGHISPLGNMEIQQKCQASIDKGYTIANKLFDLIYDNLTDDQKSHCYYINKNKEFGKLSINKDRYFFYDFVISGNYKKCIEFNGDYWHCNPRLFEADYISPSIKKTAKEIWEYDKVKIQSIEKDGFEVLTVWELDYTEDKDKVVKQILEFIGC